MLKKLPLKSTKFNPHLRMRVEIENKSSHNKIDKETRVFLESLNFEIEMRVSQKSAAMIMYI